MQTETCDDKICNDRGKCFVNLAGETICECSTKYSGTKCQFLTRKLLIQIILFIWDMCFPNLMVVSVKYMFFALLDYVKTSNKWCGQNELGIYNDQIEAQNACNEENDCSGFYDLKSENTLFVLCQSPHFIKRSDYLGSSLYIKCKISIQDFLSRYT